MSLYFKDIRHFMKLSQFECPMANNPILIVFSKSKKNNKKYKKLKDRSEQLLVLTLYSKYILL